MSAKETARFSKPLWILRGTLASVLASVVLVLIFAVMVLLFDWGEAVITPVNQVIKVLSILCGTHFAAKGMKGLTAGVCVGGAYMALGILLYSAFSGRMLPAAAAAGDLALGCVSGLLCGMLCGTMKKV